MRHLLALPALCTVLAACAAPQAGDVFTLEPGRAVTMALGMRLTLDAADDSRCPPGVRCVWAGKLAYRFGIRRGGALLETFTLSPGEPGVAPGVLGGRRVVLDESSVRPP